MAKRTIALPYFGGKNDQLKWLLPLLTPPKKERIYVEPFCGSLAVAMNRHHTGEQIIVNDIDLGVINFFTVLREEPDELIRLISLSPLHREEWRRSRKHDGDRKFIMANPVEAARQFYVSVTQSFSGVRAAEGGGGWGRSESNTRERIEARLMEAANAIQHFRFESKDALGVIKQYAKLDAMVYVDPPYMQETRKGIAYRHDDFEGKHKEMLELCLQSEAWIAISGYPSDLYSDMLKDWNVHTQDVCVRASSEGLADGNRGARRRGKETVWMNYTPQGAANLFW